MAINIPTVRPSVSPRQPTEPFLARPSERERVDAAVAAREAPATNDEIKYRASIQKYIADEATVISQKGLTRKPGAEPIVKFHPGHAKRGVAVVMPGISSTPKHWEYLVNDLYNKGYDVFVPSLPGHGLLKDGKEDISLVPTAQTVDQWDTFQDRVYGAVGDAHRISLLGHSTGALLALRMAENHQGKKFGLWPFFRHNQIERVVTISPPFGLVGDSPVPGVSNEQLAQKLAAAVLESKKSKTQLDAQVAQMLAAPTRLRPDQEPIPGGFTKATLNHVVGLNMLAAETRGNAAEFENSDIAVKMVLSEADTQADFTKGAQFAQQIGAGTLVFPEADKVPHSMYNPLYNAGKPYQKKVNEFILDFFSDKSPESKD